MDKSATISELAKALNKFQSLMGAVIFDSTNPFFKSKYATLSAIVATAKPILANCGLSVSQLTEGEGGVTTILMHTSGEYLASTLTLKATKDDPQGHGSAITYARRYAYASILGIVSDEDDGGNTASQKIEELINAWQIEDIKKALTDKDLTEANLLKYMGVSSISDIKAKDYVKATTAINSAKKVFHAKV